MQRPNYAKRSFFFTWKNGWKAAFVYILELMFSCKKTYQFFYLSMFETWGQWILRVIQA